MSNLSQYFRFDYTNSQFLYCLNWVDVFPALKPHIPAFVVPQLPEAMDVIHEVAEGLAVSHLSQFH